MNEESKIGPRWTTVNDNEIGTIKLNYYDEKDISLIKDKDTKAVYELLFKIIYDFLNRWNIEERPGLIFQDCIYSMEGSDLFAVTFLKKEHPEIEKTVIMISESALKNKYLTFGVLLHELRHIWQTYNRPEIRSGNFYGIEACYDESEIDADAYAISILASQYLSWNFPKAASILCPNEKKCCKDAYNLRIERAKEYCENLPITGAVYGFFYELLDKIKENIIKAYDNIQLFVLLYII